MIDRGEIVKNVFLKLGENTIYNDNKSELFKVCDNILTSVIDNIAYSSAFLFNAVTIELTSYAKNGNEYKFNLPIDCLNVLRADGAYRLENEFILSTENKIRIQYCRKIELFEFPDNLFNLLVAMTSRDMAFAYPTYTKLLDIMTNEVIRLQNDVIAQQGFQYWGD